MKKTLYCYLEYVIYIIVIHVVTLILRPMSWTVLSGKLINRDMQGVLESVSNLFIFIITVFIVTIFFSIDNGSLSIAMSFKNLLKKHLWLVLLVRLLTDFLQLSLPSTLSWIAMIIEAFSWFIIFLFIKKAACLSKIQHSKKELYCTLAGGAALVVIICLYIFRFYADLSEMQYLISKYADSSYVFDASTPDFRLQLIRLLFSIVLWITLFIYFGLFSAYCRRRTNTKEGFLKLAARALSLVVISMLIIAVKFLVCPIGLLNNFGRVGIYGDHSVKDIHSSFSTTTLKRKLTYTDLELVYRNTRVTLLYGNDKILSFSRKLNQENGHLIKIDLPGVEFAYRYDFDAIAYENNDHAFAIECEKINGYQKKDDALIQICEQLIQDGYFEAFEYSYQYLLKYDNEFITPYLEQYISGNFDNSFYEINQDINPDYIKQFIKDMQY